MTEEKSCCKEKKESKGWLQGIVYGLIPHLGCIAFIIGSVLGVTLLMNLFRPLLISRYLFYILVSTSLALATLSSMLYLKKNQLLSWQGTKKKWKYLSLMYGSTLGVNLLLFLVLFPLLANVSSAAPGGNYLSESSLTTLNLKVDIPCSGHAPLISQELKTLPGISKIQFSLPSNFEIQYDSKIVIKEKILALEIFKTYPAQMLSDSSASPKSVTANLSGCCGGTSACGSGCSSCGKKD